MATITHGIDISSFGGHLRCERCGAERPLGDSASKLQHGWPSHCGETMMWWTQRQIDDGEMPPLREG